MRARKEALRKQTLKQRDALPEEEREHKSRRIAEAVSKLPEFRAAQTVLLFASYSSEVDTWRLICQALDAGKTVALPRVEEDRWTLSIRRVRDLGKDLQLSRWGIMEPEEHCQLVELDKLDFVLVPGVAFDEQGRRLGYGGGFYDSLLRSLAAGADSPALVAIAFEMQVVVEVPSDHSDVPIPLILTEQRTINTLRCDEAPG